MFRLLTTLFCLLALSACSTAQPSMQVPPTVPIPPPSLMVAPPDRLATLAPSTRMRDATGVIIQNYGAYFAVRQQLIDLQSWVASETKIQTGEPRP